MLRSFYHPQSQGLGQAGLYETLLKNLGAGETAQWLRALVLACKGSGFISSIYISAHNRTPVLRDHRQTRTDGHGHTRTRIHTRTRTVFKRRQNKHNERVLDLSLGKAIS